jgi:hypothetical protein
MGDGERHDSPATHLSVIFHTMRVLTSAPENFKYHLSL